MEWFSVVLGPLSLAGTVLLLLVALVILLWAGGRLEGYDPVNEMLLRDNPALGVRYAFFIVAVVFALLGIFDRAQGDSGVMSLTQHAALAAALIYL